MNDTHSLSLFLVPLTCSTGSPVAIVVVVQPTDRPGSSLEPEEEGKKRNKQTKQEAAIATRSYVFQSHDIYLLLPVGHIPFYAFLSFPNGLPWKVFSRSRRASSSFLLFCFFGSSSALSPEIFHRDNLIPVFLWREREREKSVVNFSRATGFVRFPGKASCEEKRSPPS